MKKRLVTLVLFGVLLGVTSCGQSKNTVENKEDSKKAVESEKPATEKNKGEQKEEKAEDNTEEENNTAKSDEGKEVSIYFTNPESGVLEAQTVKVEKLDAQLIWSELQKVGMAGASTAVLGIEIDEEMSTMTLDLNQAFGNELREAGTTEEKEMLDSIVYTYLDAFQCQKIKLTEEGGALVSGHKEYTDYIEKK